MNVQTLIIRNFYIHKYNVKYLLHMLQVLLKYQPIVCNIIYNSSRDGHKSRKHCKFNSIIISICYQYKKGHVQPVCKCFPKGVFITHVGGEGGWGPKGCSLLMLVGRGGGNYASIS